MHSRKRLFSYLRGIKNADVFLNADQAFSAAQVYLIAMSDMSSVSSYRVKSLSLLAIRLFQVQIDKQISGMKG